MNRIEDLTYSFTLTELEKKEIRILNEKISALYELKLGVENLEADEDEKKSLMEEIKRMGIQTDKSIRLWWIKKQNKYLKEIKDRIFKLDYKSNKVFSKIIE